MYDIYKLYSALILLGLDVTIRRMLDGRMQIVGSAWDVVEIDDVLEFYNGEDAIKGDALRMVELIAILG